MLVCQGTATTSSILLNQQQQEYAMDYYNEGFSSLSITPVNKTDESPWSTTIGQDCVSLNVSMAKFLIPRLRFLAQYSHSVPPQFTPNKWRTHLLEKAEMLESWCQATCCGYEDEQLQRDVQVAMTWIGKNFLHLWD